MILLDTNALVWMQLGHPRSKRLARHAGRLYVSPASVLEVQFLLEAGRLRLRRGILAGQLAEDDRVVLDDPPAAAWFEEALGLAWTRDPFDRLIVAHAALRRWQLATGDLELLERLGGGRSLPL